MLTLVDNGRMRRIPRNGAGWHQNIGACVHCTTFTFSTHGETMAKGCVASGNGVQIDTVHDPCDRTRSKMLSTRVSMVGAYGRKPRSEKPMGASLPNGEDYIQNLHLANIEMLFLIFSGYSQRRNWDHVLNSSEV